MKQLSSILLLLILLSALSPVAGQEVTVSRSAVIEQYKGKPYYLHFVRQGETIAAIAQVYNVTRDELLAENKDLQSGLKVDQVLRIPQRPEGNQTLVVSKPEAAQVPGSSPVKIRQTETEPKTEPNVTISEGKTKPLVPEANPQEPTSFRYEVKRKETLYGISKKFNVTVEEILNANPQMQALQEGMEINIPVRTESSKPEKKAVVKPAAPASAREKTTQYKEITVQKGQTAYSISKQYGITVEQFYVLNPEASQGLKLEQTVRVPVNGNEAVPSSELKPWVNIGQEAKKPAVAEKPLSYGVSKDSCYNRKNALKTYEIALLLPLALEESDSIMAQQENSDKSIGDYRAFDFFQFYSGIMMAADTLEKSGFRANIHVLDADADGDSLKTKKVLRKNDLSGMDLVIGPIFVSGFDVASRYALKEKVNIVNPLSRRDKIVAGNPYVYKTQPPEESVADGMAAFIAAKYAGANIIVIRNGNKEMASLYEDFARALKRNDTPSKTRFKEVNYATESFNGVSKALASDKRNVVLLFTTNRSLVPNFVSRLNSFVKTNEITLFGMPGWENIEIETDFLVNLDYHQFSTSFIDYESEPVKQFVKQFRAVYSTEPLAEKQAFLGYDLGNYFFRALMNYGPDFGPCLKFDEVKGLQYNFRFTALSPRDGYQNSSYKIIRLQDYKWVEAR